MQKLKRLALICGVAGVTVLAAFLVYAWHPEIAKIQPPAKESFSSEQIEKGRVLAGAGNCASCHTLPDGPDYAGGRGMHTPFGILYVTNITPDPETGIGRWSKKAFVRAMRRGISRDGSHQFPAFPFIEYKNASDEDLGALYAYFMTRTPVKSTQPENTIPFPLNIRLFQAAWKLLFFSETPREPVKGKSEQWNRGAYLAEGLGHCSACHTPRNFLGAERGGKHHYAGALVDGWFAPALNAANGAALPWTADELYQYLRTGASPLHGVAGGSMGHVIGGLDRLPDEDIQAMAAYFADLAHAPEKITREQIVAAMAGRDISSPSDTEKRGAELFASACTGCHYNRPGDPQALRPEMSLNSAVTGPNPTNLLRLIIQGVSIPAGNSTAYMHGYGTALSDTEVVAVARYLRAKYKPDASSDWRNLVQRVHEIRRRAEENRK